MSPGVLAQCCAVLWALTSGVDEAIQDFQFDAELIVWSTFINPWGQSWHLGQNAGFHFTFHEIIYWRKLALFFFCRLLFPGLVDIWWLSQMSFYLSELYIKHTFSDILPVIENEREGKKKSNKTVQAVQNQWRKVLKRVPFY